MNKRQTCILGIGLLLISAATLFPPFRVIDAETYTYRDFLFSRNFHMWHPPSNLAPNYVPGRIDFERLGLEWVFFGTTSIGIALLFHPKSHEKKFNQQSHRTASTRSGGL